MKQQEVDRNLSDDGEEYEADTDGEEYEDNTTYDSRPPGVIQFRTQTLLLWLVAILLVLVVIDTLMVFDLWLTLQRFRDALSHLTTPPAGQ